MGAVTAAHRPRSPLELRARALYPTSHAAAKPKRFHGTAVLDPTRVGRDASRIAEEVIAHLTGLGRAKVIATIVIEAEVPGGVPAKVVRTVTENSRTLKFSSRGFEKE
jgi:hypothetical protein